MAAPQAPSPARPPPLSIIPLNIASTQAHQVRCPSPLKNSFCVLESSIGMGVPPSRSHDDVVEDEEYMEDVVEAPEKKVGTKWSIISKMKSQETTRRISLVEQEMDRKLILLTSSAKSENSRWCQQTRNFWSGFVHRFRIEFE